MYLFKKQRAPFCSIIPQVATIAKAGLRPELRTQDTFIPGLPCGSQKPKCLSYEHCRTESTSARAECELEARNPANTLVWAGGT